MEVDDIFHKHGLGIGRMISFSKSQYVINNPDSKAVFNANVVTEDGKAWYGDLDITKDGDKLKAIAAELQKDLYVLREMDYRFDTDGRSFDEVKSVAAYVFKHS